MAKYRVFVLIEEESDDGNQFEVNPDSEVCLGEFTELEEAEELKGSIADRYL